MVVSRIGLRRLAATLTTAALALAAGLAATAGPAAPTTPVPVTAAPATVPMVHLSGHGLGDGVGMGQWGALGYALNGYSYPAILQHYYGGTTMATIPDRSVRVVLTANDGMDTVVSAATAFSVDGHAFAPGTAARLHLLTSGGFALSSAPSCAASTWKPVDTLPASAATAVPAGATPVIQLCSPTGQAISYRGDIAASSYQGSARTLNVVSLEDYLDSVVPAESPPYWGSLGRPGAQGSPEGFQELETQAVAARSYVMSDLGQYGFADICDTTDCQSYPGLSSEDAITNLAVADTAGEVLERAGGVVANTQYSASTGGYTTGGSFPAVPDPGDAICVRSACNPNHDWSTQIPVTTIEATYPAIGVLRAIQVTRRNGLGDLGGRVESLTLQGSGGHLNLTGDAFAAALGLDSNWFSVTSLGSTLRLVGARMLDSAGDVLDAGTAAYQGSLAGFKLTTPLVGIAGSPDGGGYWLLGSGGQLSSFGDARLYGTSIVPGRRYVGIAPTKDGGGYWLAAAGGGVYAFGDAALHAPPAGAAVPTGPITAIAATPDGGGYWLVSAAGNVYSFGDAQRYGSTAGMRLPLPIVGIAPSPDGGGYWMLESNGGVFSFGDATYHGSLPGLKISNRRATTLVPTPDGGGYLVGTTAGIIYSFGDAPSLGPPATGFRPPVVGLVGVTVAKG
jgi:SpoIID/LytB domain protein